MRATADWMFVLKAFVASRVFYLLAGGLFASVGPTGPAQREYSAVQLGSLNLWANFDAEHYLNVAASGYSQPPLDTSPVFFPLYPLLIRLAALLFGGPISWEGLSVWGVLISLAVLPFALYFVYCITEEGWGVRAAKGSVLALAFFPTAFFLNAVYTESLFLTLSAGAVWAARIRRNLLLACLFAALATVTRNVGVFLLIPLVFEWLRNRQEFGWQAASLTLVPSGLLLYMAWLWWRFGEPLLFYKEQADWDRKLTPPVDTIANSFRLAYEEAQSLGRSISDPLVYDILGAGGSFSLLRDLVSIPVNLFNLLFFLFAVVVMTLGFRLLPAGLSTYGLVLVIFPALFPTTLQPLLSMPRFVLVAFPLFIVLGVLLQDRRLLLFGWVAASAIISLFFCALFVGWYWVG